MTMGTSFLGRSIRSLPDCPTDNTERGASHSQVSDGLTEARNYESRAKPLPPQSVLNDLLRYDASSGRLYWRTRPQCYFSGPDAARRWNADNARKEAFTYSNKGTCRCGKIFGSIYAAHRVIWRMVYGDEPPCIDHINGDPLDNRITNLRSVTYSENLRNRRISSNNKSGKMGVSYARSMQRWVACIYDGGKKLHLGSFRELADAIAAREAAEARIGYHKNHGRSA